MSETLGQWEERTGYERLAKEIADLPETERGEVVLVPALPISDPITLMEREHSGLRVELRWNRETDSTSVVVTLGDETTGAYVPKDKALDAFNHPYVYLPA